MNNIRLLLLDPRHKTRGLHNSYVPINIGYIGEFLKKRHELEFELRSEGYWTSDYDFDELKFNPNLDEFLTCSLSISPVDI